MWQDKTHQNLAIQALLATQVNHHHTCCCCTTVQTKVVCVSSQQTVMKKGNAQSKICWIKILDRQRYKNKLKDLQPYSSHCQANGSWCLDTSLI